MLHECHRVERFYHAAVSVSVPIENGDVFDCAQ
jgi:hypothetical protein